MPTTPHGFHYPDPLDARNVPAHMQALAEDVDDHAVYYATDAADRDSRFADLPIGALVSDGTSGNLWQKTTTGNTWRTLYADTGIVTTGFTAGTDWSIDYAEASITAGMVTVQAAVTWNGANPIQGVNDGSLPDQQILVIPPKFGPKRKVNETLMAWFFSATIVINPGGTVTLTCMQGDQNSYIRVGDSCTFGASYRAAS